MSKYLQISSSKQNLLMITNMKRSFHKDQKIEQRIVNRSFSNYQPKSPMSQSCPQSPFKKIQSKKIVLDTLKLLNYFYKSQGNQFYNIAYNFLKIDWEKDKKRLDKYLNQLCYIQESMKKKNYVQIEQQLIKQWRKNSVLYCLRTFWYNYVTNKQFKKLSQFTNEYIQFSQFVGQLAFLYYKNFFAHLQANNKNINILDKLTQRSSHFIITHTSSWCKFHDSILLPLIRTEFSGLSANIVFTQQDIQNLQSPQNLIDLFSQQNQLPNTSQALIKFIQQPRLLQKINLLQLIRQKLQQQIYQKQTTLLKTGTLSKFVILDKDSLIDCLIYCVMKEKISIQRIHQNLFYFEIIFRDNLQTILSSFSCGSYFTDIQVIYNYLSKQKSQTQNKIVQEK